MPSLRLWVWILFCSHVPVVAWAECLLWSQSRCDAQNSAAIDLTSNDQQPPRTWTFDGSGRVWGYEPGQSTWSSPALGVVGEIPMVVAGNYDHALYALHAATGNMQWRFHTGGPIYSAPVFYQDGQQMWLYATSNDRLVYAIDPVEGRQRWVHSVESYRPTLGGARLASPVVGGIGSENDTLFVPYWVWDRSLGRGIQESAIVALSLSEGKVRWRTVCGDGELTSAIFVRQGDQGYLFLGSSTGNTLAISTRDGHIVWKKAELDSVRSPPAFVAADSLVVTASKFGMIRGLDALSGTERWQRKTGDRITSSPAVLEKDHPGVLIGSYDRKVYRLISATGAPVWEASYRAGVYSSPALVVRGEPPRFLVMAWDHMLHVGDFTTGVTQFSSFTGRPLWNVGGMDDSNWSSPAVGYIRGHTMAFVGSYDGSLRGLLLDDSDRVPPKAGSNFWFWFSFPLVLIPFALLAVFLTQVERRRRKL